jgi:hypothetical protein
MTTFRRRADPDFFCGQPLEKSRKDRPKDRCHNAPKTARLERAVFELCLSARSPYCAGAGAGAGVSGAGAAGSGAGVGAGISAAGFSPPEVPNTQLINVASYLQPRVCA